MAEALSPRSVGELIGQTFRLTFRNLFKLLTIYLMFLIPFAIVQLLLEVEANIGDKVMVALSNMIYFAVGPIPAAAALIVVADEFVGERSSIRTCYRVAFERAGILIVVGLVYTLAMTLGFILLVIPGFIVMARYLVAAQVAVVERGDVGGAFARSRDLTEGRRVPYLAVLFVCFLFVAVPGWLFGEIFAAVWASSEAFIDQLVMVVRTIVSGVAAVCIYFDARVRKDALDVAQLSDIVEAIDVPRDTHAPVRA